MIPIKSLKLTFFTSFNDLKKISNTGHKPILLEFLTNGRNFPIWALAFF
jgi:hypothetical protein